MGTGTATKPPPVVAVTAETATAAVPPAIPALAIDPVTATTLPVPTELLTPETLLGPAFEP